MACALAGRVEVSYGAVMTALIDRIKGVGLRTTMNLPPWLQRLLVVIPTQVDGVRLAPELQLLLRLQRLVREPAVESLPLAQARVAMRRQAQMVGGQQSIGSLRELTVPGAAGELPARLYQPSAAVAAQKVPTLMFFHGGGWIYGDLDSHDAACRYLAETSGVQVLSVAYRLAPEVPFPGPVEDAKAAYQWLATHPQEVNADPQRLAVGGDSAGGNLAAVVALWAAQQELPLHFQLLIYPAVDFISRRPSRHLFANGFFLTQEFMDQCELSYAHDHPRHDPQLSPIHTHTFPSNLAPAFIVTAGFDPLRDEGEAYAEVLQTQGIQAELFRADQLIHGFFNMVGAGHHTRAANARIARQLATAMQ